MASGRFPSSPPEPRQAPAGGPSRPPWAQGQPPNLGQGTASRPKPVRQQANPLNRLATPTAPTNSAYASLMAELAPYGLQTLGPWAWREYLRLGGGTSAQDQIALELPNQPAFQARFPAIAMRQRAGLPALSPADYLSYEASLDAELAKVGAPGAIRAGTPAFAGIVTQGLANDVSINEMQARIEGGYQAVRDADPSVRGWFADKFGVQGDHALAAYFLAPEHSEATLARMEREAEIGGAASRAGISLGVETAGQVAAINPQGDVTSQMQRLAELDPLFHQRAGDAAGLTTDQGVAAEFGLDATSAAAVQRALDARRAAVGGNAVITSDQTGLTGVGVAR